MEVAETLERARQPVSMFIISQDWAIQNVVEQVGLTCGYPSIAVGTVQEAEAKLAELGPEAVALIVMDTGVLEEGSADIHLEASRLLQTWSSQYPDLPVVCLGTALQKVAILATQPALVPFVTMPFSPHDLMQTVQPLLPESRGLPPMLLFQTRATDQTLGGGPMREPPSGAPPPGGG